MGEGRERGEKRERERVRERARERERERGEGGGRVREKERAVRPCQDTDQKLTLRLPASQSVSWYTRNIIATILAPIFDLWARFLG